MKQQITLEEFNQLPEKERDELLVWLANRRYPKEMTIGQMIEFLNEKDYLKLDFSIHCWQENAGDSEELSDYLWGAIKEIL